MNIRGIGYRLLILLTAFGAFTAAVFCDAVAPGASNSKPIPEEPPGYDWGYIASGAIFAFAGAIILVWIGRKISKRASK